ncbi:MAG: rRNA maturation RNase YbeY [Rickettsiales bacterium]|nr:rRNA maturation RNase YbeY [Rickettsiales bacterium]
MVSWLLDKIDINISVQDDIWSLEQYQSIISEAIYTVLDHLNLMDEFKSSSISIVLTNDNFIQSLNKQYRFIDKPTNVLSFPQERNLDFGEDCLGDIILSFERIKEEGDQQNKEFQSHLIHLVIHGLLHVLGYDHETNDQAIEMEAIEIAVLGKLNIENPY